MTFVLVTVPYGYHDMVQWPSFLCLFHVNIMIWYNDRRVRLCSMWIPWYGTMTVVFVSVPCGYHDMVQWPSCLCLFHVDTMIWYNDRRVCVCSMWIPWYSNITVVLVSHSLYNMPLSLNPSQFISCLLTYSPRTFFVWLFFSHTLYASE